VVQSSVADIVGPSVSSDDPVGGFADERQVLLEPGLEFEVGFAFLAQDFEEAFVDLVTDVCILVVLEESVKQGRDVGISDRPYLF